MCDECDKNKIITNTVKEMSTVFLESLVEFEDKYNAPGAAQKALMLCVSNWIHSIELSGGPSTEDQIENIFKALCGLVTGIKNQHNNILEKPDSELDDHQKKIKAQIVKQGFVTTKWGKDGKPTATSSN